MTLTFVVDEILKIGNVWDITQAKILDNSHDKGLIICEIIELIINQKPKKLVEILENNIYIVKKEEIEYNQCIERLKAVEFKYNLPEIDWKIFINPIEVYHKFVDHFDVVLGKAPYIKVHNTIDDFDRYFFTQNKGITNSYTSDYLNELKVLNRYGKLIYIVFNNRAAFFINEYMNKKAPNLHLNSFVYENKNNRSKTYINFIVINQG